MKISTQWASGLGWAAKAALVLLGVLAVAFALWWAFIRPVQLRNKVAVAQAQQTVAAAAPKIAAETLREVERVHERTIEIHERVAAGNAAIAAAPGAAAAIPADVDAAGRAAVCMLDLYRDDPGCAPVQRLRAAQPVGGDTGSAAAGG